MNQAQQYFPTEFVGTTAHRYRQGGTYTNSIINLDGTDQIYYFLGMSLTKTKETNDISKSKFLSVVDNYFVNDL